MDLLKKLCKLSQKGLFNKLKTTLKNRIIKVKDGKYIFVQGNSPILLVCHLDTVHKNTPQVICEGDGNILMSPQGIGGDDRCGVYAALKLYDEKLKPYLLFTCDEEIGGVGAREFARDVENKKLPNLSFIKFCIEIDRKGKNDAVFYYCDNKDFTSYIVSKGFKEEYGSYSDIVDICPALGCAGVNLSSGYYNAHTLHEYINLNQLKKVIEKVKGIVKESDSLPRYEYIEKKFSYTLPKGNWEYYDWSKYYGSFSKGNKKYYTNSDWDYADDIYNTIPEKEWTPSERKMLYELGYIDKDGHRSMPTYEEEVESYLLQYFSQDEIDLWLRENPKKNIFDLYDEVDFDKIY